MENISHNRVIKFRDEDIQIGAIISLAKPCKTFRMIDNVFTNE